jgi:uncharacterized protein YyaL (SSP411 family)
MLHPTGGFFASLDSDSDGAEWAFNIWGAGDTRQALAGFEHAGLALAALRITPHANFEGRTVLRRAAELEALAVAHSVPNAEIEAVRNAGGTHLLDARPRRTPPACEDRIFAEWNGLPLMLLAEAARATHEEQDRSASQELAAFLASTLMHADRIVRTWRDIQPGPTGVLQDDAALALGFLAKYRATLTCDSSTRLNAWVM